MYIRKVLSDASAPRAPEPGVATFRTETDRFHADHSQCFRLPWQCELERRTERRTVPVWWNFDRGRLLVAIEILDWARATRPPEFRPLVARWPRFGFRLCGRIFVLVGHDDQWRRARYCWVGSPWLPWWLLCAGARALGESLRAAWARGLIRLGHLCEGDRQDWATLWRRTTGKL